jgi:hypothetical protein
VLSKQPWNDYWLQVSAFDSETDAGSSVFCYFCTCLEERAGAKWKSTERTKYFDHFEPITMSSIWPRNSMKNGRKMKVCSRHMINNSSSDPFFLSCMLPTNMVQLARDENNISLTVIGLKNYPHLAVTVFLQLYMKLVFGLCTLFGTRLFNLHGISYLDVQMWLTIKMEIHNFHLLVVSLFDSHAGENIFIVVSKFLDALYASLPVHQLMLLVP